MQELAKAGPWDPSKHPRAQAGTPQGGQFAAGGNTGSGGGGKPKGSKRGKPKAHKRPQPTRIQSDRQALAAATRAVGQNRHDKGAKRTESAAKRKLRHDVAARRKKRKHDAAVARKESRAHAAADRKAARQQASAAKKAARQQAAAAKKATATKAPSKATASSSSATLSPAARSAIMRSGLPPQTIAVMLRATGRNAATLNQLTATNTLTGSRSVAKQTVSTGSSAGQTVTLNANTMYGKLRRRGLGHKTAMSLTRRMLTRRRRLNYGYGGKSRISKAAEPPADPAQLRVYRKLRRKGMSHDQAMALCKHANLAKAKYVPLHPPIIHHGKINWVDRVGGLPGPIDAIARVLISHGWDESRAVATAVSQAKEQCATGRAAGGHIHLGGEARATICAAVASWEAKKAAA